MAVTQISKAAAVVEVKSPVTGEIVGTVPNQGEDEVAAAVVRARVAATTWGQTSFVDRRRALVGFRRALADHADELAEIIHRENGKPRVDAILELAMALSHLQHAADRAARALRPTRVSAGLMVNFRAQVSYHPIGVVGVIGPWNYPIFTPMGSIAYALAAGNAVVFKPSELTPLIAVRVAELAAATLPEHVLQIVTGDGRTGAALAKSAVDKLAFTGSTATGRKIMVAAAERLTPVLLELGGKDAMIVAEDADLDAAAEAAVYGALTNAGQACTSIERCYVVDAVYRPFLAKVLTEVQKVRWGQDDDAHIGAITMPRQVDLIRAHLEDAIALGATVLTGGPEAIRGNFVPPTVLTDVTAEMRIMREETFGPILPIARVADLDEAVAASNSTAYGLGSAVFAGREARALADRLRAGMTAVNAVLAFAAVPALPFGGVGESGFGRIHGDEGLREFSRVKGTAEQRFRLPMNMLSFKLPLGMYDKAKGLIHNLYGGGPVDRAGDLWRRFRG